MARRSIPLVALLVLLAGCTTFAPAPATDTPTQTPAFAGELAHELTVTVHAPDGGERFSIGVGR